jgi:hypothetical protein
MRNLLLQRFCKHSRNCFLEMEQETEYNIPNNACNDKISILYINGMDLQLISMVVLENQHTSTL